MQPSPQRITGWAAGSRTVSVILIAAGGLVLGSRTEAEAKPLHKLAPEAQRARLVGDARAVSVYRRGLSACVAAARSQTRLFPAEAVADPPLLREQDKDQVRSLWKSFLNYQMALEHWPARLLAARSALHRHPRGTPPLLRRGRGACLGARSRGSLGRLRGTAQSTVTGGVRPKPASPRRRSSGANHRGHERRRLPHHARTLRRRRLGGGVAAAPVEAGNGPGDLPRVPICGTAVRLRF